MRLGYWILDDEGRMKQVDLMTWAFWFEKAENRIVKQEWIGDNWISTVFLGMDHSFTPAGGPPVLWETMIFRGKPRGDEYYCDRCAGNREQAEAMHQKAVEFVKNYEGQKMAPKK